MVKVYFTYQFNQVLGQVTYNNCNFIYQPVSNIFIAGVNQYISIISGKNGEVLNYLYKANKNCPVRCLFYKNSKIYAGYEDGSITVWSLTTKQQLFSFDFHKSTVSNIILCEAESKMISAGMDGNIMIWDLLTQQVQIIKSAHASTITQIQSLQLQINGKPTHVILSVGKDGFLRVWDLVSHLCLSALSCQVTQVYCMYLDSARNILYIGTNKEDIVIVQFAAQLQNSKSICEIKEVFKKNSFAHCVKIVADQSNLYIFNSDRTIQVYKLLQGKDLEARKKRLLSRKKKNQNAQEEIKQIEQISTQLKLIQQKMVPFKYYGAFVYNGRIFLNNSSNIYQIGVDEQITHSFGQTLQLSLQYPFLAQRSQRSINILSSNTSTKLYSIPVKCSWCHLFTSGFLLIAEQNSVQIWNLLKNQQVFKLQQKWIGCTASKNKCILWRENQIGIYQIGYDKSKNIKMKQIETRRFQDKITQVRYKHNMQKYIVNLQNSQILINYSDTHKNFLKLYGHKFPILSFSVSTDDAILATGSIDKDIRLWDMDFGHSIKSIFAHQQAVTVVKFVPETHYLFSGSKDGHIKYWDMDTYQLIMDFQQCTLEIKDIAVSQAGDIFFAGGLDEGLRIWKQTNDQTIASDMQQKQMEKVMIQDYTKQKFQNREEKTRYQDLKHGQQIIEALQNKQTPKKLISLLKKVPPANLKNCLSFLHQKHKNRLYQYIKLLVDANIQQEVCWRVIKQLGYGTDLANKMRLVWRPVQKTIQLNVQILRTLMKQITEQGQFIN